jgi:type I restriction enzyme S subunit
MSWQPYPHYSDSGVEWMGPIPSDWDVVRTRFLCDIQTGDKDTVNSNMDGEFPFYVRSQTVERIDTWSFDCEAVLTAGDGAGVGKIYHHVEGRFDAHQRVYVFNNFRRVLGRYFYFYLSTLFARVALDGGAKSTVDSLRRPVLAGFPVAVPDLTTQERIVEFLEVESERIDALIHKQEQLIATLREDRTATITHAVTKGLDTAVEMKHSGVEWFGQVPAHWSLTQMRHLVSEIEQGVSPQAYAELANDNTWGVLKAGCVNGGVFADIQHKRLPEDFDFNPAIEVKVGDLLVCRASGSPHLVGSAAIVRTLRFRLILSDKIFRLSPCAAASAEYLEKVMNSRVYREQVGGAISGAEGLANNLPSSALRAFVFAMPPVDEQDAIVQFLNGRCARIDALIGKATQVIETLREYRSALITAAVTGKIDVRGAA